LIKDYKIKEESIKKKSKLNKKVFIKREKPIAAYEDKSVKIKKESFKLTSYKRTYSNTESLPKIEDIIQDILSLAYYTRRRR
jgi:hypothetical protein